MSDGSDGRAAIDSVVGGSGPALVPSADPVAVALKLCEALDADLLEGADGLEDAVEDRRKTLARRSEARAAIALGAQLDPVGRTRHVVTDVAALRRLVTKARRAEDLVRSGADQVRARVTQSIGASAHPDAIRAAASDLRAAQSEVVTIRAEVDRAEAAWSGADATFGSAATSAAVPPLEPEREELPSGLLATWTADDRGRFWRAAALVLIALLVAALVALVGGGALAIVVVLPAVAWLVAVVMRRERDADDRDLAADNLATISAMTDRAYGGVGASDLDEVPESLVVLRDRLADATDRLAGAERTWRNLAGPGADVDDLDAVLRAHGPRAHVDGAELAATPTVRAAEAHARRLRARWKAAWYVLDRPVPALGNGDEAVDRLEEEGVDEITLPGWHEGADDLAEIHTRFEQLAAGRSIEQLTAAADEPVRPVVVLDEDGAIDEARLVESSAGLTDEVRIVVVTATSAAG